MWYRSVLRWVAYSAVFFMFSYAEGKLAVFGFSLALLMALFYARENLFIILPVFVLSQLLFHWSLAGVVFAAVPVVVVFFAALVQYKLKLKGKLPLINLYTLLSTIPFAVFAAADVKGVVSAMLSVIATMVTLNMFLTVLYATRVRGLRYKLSPEEIASALGTIFVLFLCVSKINILGFPLFPMFGTAFVAFAVSLSPFTAIVVGGVAGLGAALSLQNLAVAGLWFAISLGAGALKNFKIGIPIVLVATEALCNFVFGIYPQYHYFYLISSVLGGVFYLATVRPFDRYFKAFCEIQHGGIAERSVINRTRFNVAEKLRSIEDSFSEIEESLRLESGGTSGMTPSEVTDLVCQKCCKNCNEEKRCREALGETTHFVIAPLALSALQSGRASLLDMPSFLTSRCPYVNSLLNEVNSVVSVGYKRIEAQTAEKEMQALVARLVGGVRGVLGSLREEVGTPISYETKRERELIDNLNFEGICATEAVVYNNKEREVNIIVKEGDEQKAEFKETVSKVLGTQMIQTKKTPAVCGMVGLTFLKRPQYALSYGKCTLAKEESTPNGDTVEAIRLSPSKVMLILSDGMGSGAVAHDSSRFIVNVIAGFYKADFTHEAVISAASGLFSLRHGENFNAIDIAVVDLISGETDFIKMGGRESYLSIQGEVEILPAGTLPMGILEEVRPAFFCRTLASSDFFLMMSDGVADSLKEEEMLKIMASFRTVNPQTMAKEVVDNALRLGGRADDMSCVVARIFQT